MYSTGKYTYPIVYTVIQYLMFTVHCNEIYCNSPQHRIERQSQSQSKAIFPYCIARENIHCDVNENMWPYRQERQDVPEWNCTMSHYCITVLFAILHEALPKGCFLCFISDWQNVGVFFHLHNAVLQGTKYSTVKMWNIFSVLYSFSPYLQQLATLRKFSNG